MSRKRLRTVGLVGGLVMGLLLALGVAQAAPTLLGPTGMIHMPTADALNQSEFDLALHRDNDLNILDFNLGVADGLEVGLNVWGVEGYTTTSAHVKYVLAPERTGSLGVAIGGETRGEKQNSFYVVASKQLVFGGRGHLGMGTGLYNGIFAGVSKQVIPGRGRSSFPRTILMGEIMGGEFNAGARVLVSPEVNLDFALLNLDDFVFGLSFRSRF